jgi:NAD(P)-dependent dehydrogenase (short-subunit alcohol dehydrogenase family)
VVVGGAGVAGECAVHALLARGATVVVPSRSPDRLAALTAATRPEHVARLRTVVGDLGSEVGAESVRAEVVERVGPPRAIVASLGRWWEGADLVELPVRRWDGILRDNLTAHFLAARAFLPILDPHRSPVYVMLAGIAAELPVAGSAPISITGAAQRMMIQTLAVEDIGKRVRLHEVAIMTPIVTRHWNEGQPEPDWLTGDVVGEYLADVVAPDFSGGNDLLLEIPAESD